MAQPWELVVIILIGKCQRPVKISQTFSEKNRNKAAGPAEKIVLFAKS